ncbi:MAG: choice-of-anchor D domain-containing protein, partial [Chloroflexota bacterium]
MELLGFSRLDQTNPASDGKENAAHLYGEEWAMSHTTVNLSVQRLATTSVKLLIIMLIAQCLFFTTAWATTNSTDVTISATDSNVMSTTVGSTVTYTPTASGATISASNLAALLDAGNNIVVDTTAATNNGQSGTITVNAAIVKSSGSDANITLRANAGLAIRANITNIGGGQITLFGNTEGTSTGNIAGIDVGAGITIQSGSGAISLTGTGGSTGSGNYGLYLNGVTVRSTDGNLTLNGTGGHSSSGRSNSGIYAENSATVQTTGNGRITLKGTGGPGADANTGVFLNSNSVITSTGGLVITGTGGISATTINNPGVTVVDSTVADLSTYGIQMTGRSGKGTGTNRGFYLLRTALKTIDGSIELTGTVSDLSLGSTNHAIHLDNTTADSVNGDIILTGIGGSFSDGQSNSGIFLQNSTIVQTTGTGRVVLDGTSGTGTSYNAGVYLESSSAITSTGGLVMTGTGSISTTATNNPGVTMAGHSTVSDSSTDGIQMTGVAGNGTSNNSGIYLSAATINAVSGPISLTGTGGMTTTGNTNGGIYMTGNSSIANASDKQISLMGTGGNGAGTENVGIEFFGANTVESTGTGRITLNGTGGEGSATSDGVFLNGAVIVQSVTGDIQLVGQGGSGSTGADKRGIWLNNQAIVRSTGMGATAASITLDGTGGNSTSGSDGVYIATNNSQVTSVDGSITVIGRGGTGSGGVNHGVDLTNSGKIEVTGVGNITITGIAGDHNNSNGIDSSTGTFGGGTMSGTLTLIADTYNVTGTAGLAGAGTLVIKPATYTKTIGIGGGTGTLNLSDEEIAVFSDGFSHITIGNAVSGTGAVDIDSATFLDDVTIAGGTISDNAGTDITAPSVILDGDVAPGQSPGQLIISGDVTLTSTHTLTVEVNGTTVGTDYDQISVTGSITLNNITLAGTSGFTPSPHDSFTIVDNDGTDPINGTFNGIAEGDVVTFGSADFYISYMGGDGNDVVLTTRPEIDVQGNNTSIVSGDTTPSTADSTDFGTILVNGSSTARTYTIRNTGTSTLTVSLPITKTGASDFSVTISPSTEVAAGSSTTFQVAFLPTIQGTQSATLEIGNNDTDETPYTFAIQATGGAPGIAISVDDTSANETDGILNFTIRTNQVSGGPVYVNYATANSTAVVGTNYTAKSGTATIPAGSTTANVAVPIENIPVAQGNRVFKLVLSSPVFATIADGEAVGTIVDNNYPAPTPTPTPTPALYTFATDVGGIPVTVTMSDVVASGFNFTVDINDPNFENLAVPGSLTMSTDASTDETTASITVDNAGDVDSVIARYGLDAIVAALADGAKTLDIAGLGQYTLDDFELVSLDPLVVNGTLQEGVPEEYTFQTELGGIPIVVVMSDVTDDGFDFEVDINDPNQTDEIDLSGKLTMSRDPATDETTANIVVDNAEAVDSVIARYGLDAIVAALTESAQTLDIAGLGQYTLDDFELVSLNPLIVSGSLQEGVPTAEEVATHAFQTDVGGIPVTVTMSDVVESGFNFVVDINDPHFESMAVSGSLTMSTDPNTGETTANIAVDNEGDVDSVIGRYGLDAIVAALTESAQTLDIAGLGQFTLDDFELVSLDPLVVSGSLEETTTPAVEE